MKLLLVCPYPEIGQQALEVFFKNNLQALFARNLTEANQILQFHGRTIDIAIIHREGKDPQKSLPPGIALIEQIKSDTNHQDLPIILTSEEWSDIEFVEHQQSSSGVNAYLRFPFNYNEIIETIHAVLGIEISQIKLETPSYAELKTNSTNQATLQTAMSETKGFQNPNPIQIKENILTHFESNQESIPQPLPVDLTRAVVNSEVADQLIESEMPYLIQSHHSKKVNSTENDNNVFQTYTPSILPGTAGENPDNETLKKYLELREKDVYKLSHQLNEFRSEALKNTDLLKLEKAKAIELKHLYQEVKKKLDFIEENNKRTIQALENENSDLKLQIKSKSEAMRMTESKLLQTTNDSEKLKERVRQDIRKIRVREKELENKLEILRKDSEALLIARETKISELKRKIDLLEFNLDLVQDQFSKEKNENSELKRRLHKAGSIVRAAGGLLEPTERNDSLLNESLNESMPPSTDSEHKRMAS